MNTPQLKLLGKRILIELHKPVVQGIVLADDVKPDQFRGTVAGTGEAPGWTSLLNIGDEVLLSNFGGQEYREGDRIYKIVADEDVIGVFDNNRRFLTPK
jgi:co-chaperonin GroES (HSP10)